MMAARQHSSPWDFRAIARMLIEGALACLAIAAVCAWFDYRFIARTVETDAVIVAIDTGASSNANRPVLRFTTIDGRHVEAVYVHLSTPAWTVGDRLRIRYDPADPDNVSPSAFYALHIYPLLFSVFAAAFVIAAFFSWRRARREERAVESSQAG